MEAKDVLALVVSVLSAVGAIAAAIIAWRAVDNQRHTQKWTVNHDLLMRAAGMLITNPGLLDLHRITPRELAQDGISPEELIYCYIHLNAGAAFYRISEEQRVQLTQFRKNFLRNPKVRVVWKKYLRDKLFSPTPYVSAVDAYIAELEAEEQDTAMGSAMPNKALQPTALTRGG